MSDFCGVFLKQQRVYTLKGNSREVEEEEIGYCCSSLEKNGKMSHGEEDEQVGGEEEE